MYKFQMIKLIYGLIWNFRGMDSSMHVCNIITDGLEEKTDSINLL